MAQSKLKLSHPFHPLRHIFVCGIASRPSWKVRHTTPFKLSRFDTISNHPHLTPPLKNIHSLTFSYWKLKHPIFFFVVCYLSIEPKKEVEKWCEKFHPPNDSISRTEIYNCRKLMTKSLWWNLSGWDLIRMNVILIEFLMRQITQCNTYVSLLKCVRK